MLVVMYPKQSRDGSSFFKFWTIDNNTSCTTSSTGAVAEIFLT